MGKCSYCRTETNSSTCPNCGSTVSNIVSLKKDRKYSTYSSNEYSDSKFDKIEKSLDKLEGCLSKKIFYFIFTWLFMIILGIILTYLLQKNNIEFIKKYNTILQFVRIFLLSFGWLPAIIIFLKKS